MKPSMRAAATAVAVTSLGLVALGGAPASASAKKGCPYPAVCFYLTTSDYNNSHPTAQFKDVTTGFQTLGPQSRGAKGVVNTRNDDVVSIKFLDHGQGEFTTCLPPNKVWPVQSGITVTRVRIENRATCPEGP
ncbi:hypothetical protein ABT160_36970 [Streptomyces sp. NPDC001941]|uniref:hypothetical protein n=1 Tax=Streptomyces sp. NPDC001941 TaxID=3154659 RepID=UPI00332EC4E1